MWLGGLELQSSYADSPSYKTNFASELKTFKIQETKYRIQSKTAVSDNRDF